MELIRMWNLKFFQYFFFVCTIYFDDYIISTPSINIYTVGISTRIVLYICIRDK